MKNLFRLLIVLLTLSLFSCDSATEEITINADGSGEYKVYTDAISSARKMGLQMASMFAKGDVDMDSLERAVEAKIWTDFPSEIDSILDYTDQIPEDVKNDPAKMKIVNKMEGFMKGSKAEGFVNMGVRYSFDNMDDLQAFIKLLEENQKNNRQTGAPMSGINSGETEVDFQLDETHFSRNTKIIKKPELSAQELSMVKMMMPSGKLKTVIHLPKPAKNVTGKHVLENDGKTVIFEYDLLKFILGENSNNFDIEME